MVKNSNHSLTLYPEEKSVNEGKNIAIISSNLKDSGDSIKRKIIACYLSGYKIIKIKALKSIANKSNIKELASQIAEVTESYLLDVRGFTFIVSKYSINKT